MWDQPLPIILKPSYMGFSENHRFSSYSTPPSTCSYCRELRLAHLYRFHYLVYHILPTAALTCVCLKACPDPPDAPLMVITKSFVVWRWVSLYTPVGATEKLGGWIFWFQRFLHAGCWILHSYWWVSKELLWIIMIMDCNWSIRGRFSIMFL